MITNLEFHDVPKYATASTLAFIKEFCDERHIPLIDYKRGSTDNAHDQLSTVWVEVPEECGSAVYEAVGFFIEDVKAIVETRFE